MPTRFISLFMLCDWSEMCQGPGAYQVCPCIYGMGLVGGVRTASWPEDSTHSLLLVTCIHESAFPYVHRKFQAAKRRSGWATQNRARIHADIIVGPKKRMWSQFYCTNCSCFDRGKRVTYVHYPLARLLSLKISTYHPQQTCSRCANVSIRF